jgi:hypothetical protein
VHYTQVAYNNIKASINILDIPFTSTSNGYINNVYSSLQATAVIYCIFSGVIIALGSVRSILAVDLDLSGETSTYIAAIVPTIAMFCP